MQGCYSFSLWEGLFKCPSCFACFPSVSSLIPSVKSWLTISLSQVHGWKASLLTLLVSFLHLLLSPLKCMDDKCHSCYAYFLSVITILHVFWVPLQMCMVSMCHITLYKCHLNTTYVSFWISQVSLSKVPFY